MVVRPRLPQHEAHILADITPARAHRYLGEPALREQPLGIVRVGVLIIFKKRGVDGGRGRERCAWLFAGAAAGSRNGTATKNDKNETTKTPAKM